VRHFSCSRIVQQVSVDIDVAVLPYEGPCPPKAKVTSSNLVGRNDLAEVAKEPLIAAEASRKHPAGNIRTDCRVLVAPGLANKRPWREL
jgi:hypothetical protein